MAGAVDVVTEAGSLPPPPPHAANKIQRNAADIIFSEVWDI
jgi:hypothetical protein